jgi:hypothetical protein
MDFQAPRSHIVEDSIRSSKKGEVPRYRATIPKDTEGILKLIYRRGVRHVRMNVASYSALRSIWKTPESPVADVDEGQTLCSD